MDIRHHDFNGFANQNKARNTRPDGLKNREKCGTFYAAFYNDLPYRRTQVPREYSSPTPEEEFLPVPAQCAELDLAKQTGSLHKLELRRWLRCLQRCATHSSSPADPGIGVTCTMIPAGGTRERWHGAAKSTSRSVSHSVEVQAFPPARVPLTERKWLCQFRVVSIRIHRTVICCRWQRAATLPAPRQASAQASAIGLRLALRGVIVPRR